MLRLLMPSKNSIVSASMKHIYEKKKNLLNPISIKDMIDARDEKLI